MFRILILMLNIILTVNESHFDNKLTFFNYDPRTNMNGSMRVVKNKDGCKEEDENAYMNPQYIWGKDFNLHASKYVCESEVFITQGSKIKSIKFTKRGHDMCVYICNRQYSNILVGEGTQVYIKDVYCTKIQLQIAKCICVLKYQCQELSYYIFLNIIANRQGDVAMQFSESGHP